MYRAGRLGWDRCDLGVAGGVRGNVTHGGGGDDDDGTSMHDLAVRTVGGPHPFPFFCDDDDDEDDLNVIPIAVWRPVRSRRWGMNATVTSPGSPPGTAGGSGIRVTASLVAVRLLRPPPPLPLPDELPPPRRTCRGGSSHFFNVWTLRRSKCFQL